MSNVNPRLDRSDFFSGSKAEKSQGNNLNLRRNSAEKKSEIESVTKDDVKIDITNKVKDFSRIKSAVYKAENIDNSEKIKEVKDRIKNGSYRVDYEELADRLLRSEF